MVAAVPGVVIGVVQVLSGSSSPAVEVLTVVTPSLFTLWTTAVCVLLLRRNHQISGR